MKGEKLGKLLLDGLLVVEDGRLVMHDYEQLALSASMSWLMVTCAHGSHPSTHQIER